MCSINFLGRNKKEEGREEGRKKRRKEKRKEAGRERGRKGGTEVPMGLIGKTFDSPSLGEKLEGFTVSLTRGLSV